MGKYNAVQPERTLRDALKTAGKSICVILLAPALCVSTVAVQELRARRHFDRLVETNNHQAVARAAVAMMQRATDNTMYLVGNRLAELPPEIAAMQPRNVSVSKERMDIEFHGGHAHYGFTIAAEGALWDMRWYDEERGELLLSIPKDL